MLNLYDGVLEDGDFLDLYELDDTDEAEATDPNGLVGTVDLGFENWFPPSGTEVDRGLPHPFVRDSWFSRGGA